jgi:DNA modification methylase
MSATTTTGKQTKTKTAGAAPPTSETGDSDLALTLDVEPRKPRLAWQGMDRKEAVVSVPTQIVEIVRPAKAVATDAKLPGITAAHQSVRAPSGELPPNRLIWTNDNLVALRTLLDERDPVTKDYRYRGKVDLVYIDPPFMVQGDFVADNAIDIELDEDEHVEAKKEPSLVEILAYKDTWRQGLDSFLSMLRERLVLLKDLLAPTGSIYVHLDWHAVHYVKVLMDEIFGYENFMNEIVWQRQTSHNDLAQGAKHLGRVHDTILVYQAGPEPFMAPLHAPYDASYVRSHYSQVDEKGRRFQYGDLSGPGGAAKGNPIYDVMGHTKYWRFKEEKMRQLIAEGRVVQPTPGAVPRHKRLLDDMPGIPLQDVWSDVNPINSQAREGLGYPTQKPLTMLDRIIRLACPPGGLVLDCFMGSGTTAEAAERLGRRWIGIDNGKYAIHLSRKRLIQLHGQPKLGHASSPEFIECDKCKNVERKEKPQKSRETFAVRPFTVENMGVYQRAEQWQDFQTQRSRYRDEMIKVFGGEVVSHSPLLHGRKGNSWVHVGPLDGPVSVAQVWSIAREAQKTERKAVTVLSADFDTLSGSEKDEIKSATNVTVTVRIIPASAIDEVRRRLEIQRSNPDTPIESMAIPAFYAPLSIILSRHVSGRMAKLTLDRCEIDIESFIASQRPVLKPVTATTTPAAKKKAKAESDKWTSRQKELEKWLAKATSWQKFIDFWAVDWDYGRRVGPDGKPIFETDWQSFRVRRSKGEVEPLILTAEYKYTEPGHYRVAARVTDVFGNDGIATVTMEVK